MFDKVAWPVDGTQPDLTPAADQPVMTSMQTTIPSPVGPLALTVDDDGALTRIGFGAGDVSDDARFDRVVTQLPEYFAGGRTDFDLDLRPDGGSAFERRVWAALLEIPYGETASYGEIAARIGHPGKARAVGRANGRNPIAIVVPVPPRHRQRRLADRLRRRPREQAHPARPRGRRADPRDGYGLNRIVSHARRRLAPWRACATCCAPPAPSASSSPPASRGCPWARSACCSSCTPSS